MADLESDENRPLLKKQPIPLPKLQLLILFLVRFVDPLAYSQIFPYINELLEFLQVTDNPARVGFYSGLVETVYALAQFIFIFPAARLSDQVGRKPILMAGISGIAVTTLLFGMGTSLWALLSIRFLGGMFGATVAVVHSILGELTHESNQAAAFPIIGLSWTIGNVFGPLIGGSFSNPAKRFPKIFGDSELFRQHPYLLPCAVSAVLSIGFLIFIQTLPSRRKKKATHTSSEVQGPLPKLPTIRELLRIPRIRTLTLSSCFLSFNATAFDVVFVLFAFSSVERGGLSFSVLEIGQSLSIAAGMGTILQVTFLPFALHRYDSSKTYNFFIAAWPPTFLSLPLLNLIARGHLDSAGVLNSEPSRLLWFGICVTMLFSRFGLMAYSRVLHFLANMILVKESSPSTHALGSVNGLVQACLCLSRALAPAFVSSIFALSTEYQLLGGNLWSLIMCGTALYGQWMGRRIVRRDP
ncbi:major facilitator superfamily domain-containing protein [Mycena floridula]|nr:major facilitator superfamily domain-containing protein [Mycena floridula]